MTESRVLSILTLVFTVASLVFFLLGVVIDKGKRNNAKNRARAETMVYLGISSTAASWVFAAALAITNLFGWF